MRAMEDRSCRRRGLQPTPGAHERSRADPPPLRRLAARADKSVRPAQPFDIRHTRSIIGEPIPELLIGPREIDPANRLLVHPPILLHSSRYAEHILESQKLEYN